MSGSVGFLDHFRSLEDPRQSWRVVYPLPEVLLLLLCATLSGMEDFTKISLWGRERLAFLRRFPPFDRGVPSRDTLNDIVNAIDGKTSRRAHARAKGVSPRHMVSAWASRQRLVLGQRATAEKSNQIRAIPLLDHGGVGQPSSAVRSARSPSVAVASLSASNAVQLGP